jgi:hypothetical protein
VNDGNGTGSWPWCSRSRRFDEAPVLIAELVDEFEHTPPDLDSDAIRARAKKWREFGARDLIAVLTAIEKGLRR